MKNLLSGKIYWVQDDFSYNSFYDPKKGETLHISTGVDNVLIDENMIKFSTLPIKNISNEIESYNVNLIINEHGIDYSGTFANTEDRDWSGPVTCELYENKKAYFLFGKWTESEFLFTWWAKINKTIILK